MNILKRVKHFTFPLLCFSFFRSSVSAHRMKPAEISGRISQIKIRYFSHCCLVIFKRYYIATASVFLTCLAAFDLFLSIYTFPYMSENKKNEILRCNSPAIMLD